MLRTRVGYAGGSSANVNYNNIGDWMEAIQIDFDPKQVHYKDLLEIFFAEHDACDAPWKRQYASGIFFHNEAQKEVATQALAGFGTAQGRKPVTEIAPVVFATAEDYHQKYYLRQTHALAADLIAAFNKNEHNFRESTAVARVNGYLAGNGAATDLARELKELGLSEAGQKFLTLSHERNR